jgi:hypothetical protein
LNAIDEGVDGKRANLKDAKHLKLNRLKDVRSENVSVDSPLLNTCLDFMVFIKI